VDLPAKDNKTDSFMFKYLLIIQSHFDGHLLGLEDHHRRRHRAIISILFDQAFDSFHQINDE